MANRLLRREEIAAVLSAGIAEYPEVIRRRAHGEEVLNALSDEDRADLMSHLEHSVFGPKIKNLESELHLIADRQDRYGL